MNKSRPEIINVTAPIIIADKIQSILMEVLAKSAKLKRSDDSDKTIFSFIPTKSEYFLISVKLACLTRECTSTNLK